MEQRLIELILFWVVSFRGQMQTTSHQVAFQSAVMAYIMLTFNALLLYKALWDMQIWIGQLFWKKPSFLF